MFQVISGIVLRRVLLAIPTLLLLSLVVFFVLRILPVDPLAMLLPASATPADAAALRQQLGFDRPIPEQFLSVCLAPPGAPNRRRGCAASAETRACSTR